MVGSQCVYSVSGSGGSRPLRVTAILTRNPEYKGAYTGRYSVDPGCESSEQSRHLCCSSCYLGRDIAIPFA